uniref:Uncharacterized protein n=3 Tax=Klebsiella pneumoniae complex TaxID=3390273 RepID=A0A330KYU1_KLEVA|nr:hypothetical protein [Klebsiella pneumoniae subsp. pneumoniae]QBM19269.1 hypothetical protein [Klebsiella pneumoniae]WHO54289.1 hypothetical protein [Enterobacter hormaechei]SPN81011.1 hypothetical protein PCNR130_0065 [Klebsiella variicola]URZ91588.1 hypothetical protein [Klebsiella pneumoniae]
MISLLNKHLFKEVKSVLQLALTTIAGDFISSFADNCG